MMVTNLPRPLRVLAAAWLVAVCLACVSVTPTAAARDVLMFNRAPAITEVTDTSVLPPPVRRSLVEVGVSGLFDIFGFELGGE